MLQAKTKRLLLLRSHATTCWTLSRHLCHGRKSSAAAATPAAAHAHPFQEYNPVYQYAARIVRPSNAHIKGLIRGYKHIGGSSPWRVGLKKKVGSPGFCFQWQIMPALSLLTGQTGPVGPDEACWLV